MELVWLNRHTMVTPHLLLAGDESTYRDACAHLKDAWPGPWLREGFGACTHTYYKEGKLTCIVAINVAEAATREDQVPVIGLLAHEATHVVQKMYENVGEHPPGSEHQAYSMQNVLQELLWEYSRQKEALTGRASGSTMKTVPRTKTANRSTPRAKRGTARSSRRR